MDLTDLQWQVIQHLMPPVHQGRGRPAHDFRRLLDAIFWKILTASPWRELPSRYPSYQSCCRFYQLWQASGLFASVVHLLYSDLLYRGNFTPYQAFAEKRIILMLGRRSFKFFLSPRHHDDWRTLSALLFMQIELLNMKKQFISLSGTRPLRATELPKLGFFFSLWPKCAPPGFDRSTSEAYDRPEDIIFNVGRR
jgi:transposase